ncbi:hypothetical protein ACFWEJ_18745, partial [Promicromonospora sp. NPDC060204]|uniref:hypothetical protein n=1 Tax=Promicromonospora sp. NPDC060204 TaxID=3347071 RepID=UPI003669657A
AGYVEISEVYRNLQGRGFALEAVTFALASLGKYRLIEAPLDDFDPARSDRARITNVGAYTLANLPSLFTYNDAVVVDTPIIDASYRLRVGDPRSLADRVSRVEIFRNYLDWSWGQSDLAGQGWDWSSVSHALSGDLRRVAERAGVPYRPGASNGD